MTEQIITLIMLTAILSAVVGFIAGTLLTKKFLKQGEKNERL